MNDSTVERVEPLFKNQQGQTFWWLLKLKGEKQEFALHQNWFINELNLKEPRTLKAGDKVEYMISKCKMGKDGSRSVNKEAYLMFDKLTKIEEKKETLDEGEPEL